MLQESIKSFDCTTIFGEENSSICLDAEKHKLARGLFEDIARWNTTEAYKRCPRSCTALLIDLGRETKKSLNIFIHDTSRLVINFGKYIKVFTSHSAYGWLELLAEVGGYFGLFLGVSINQFISIYNQLLNTLKKIT